MKKKVPSFFRSKTQFSWKDFILIFILILIISFCFSSLTYHYKYKSIITRLKLHMIQLTQNEKALNDKIEELTNENVNLKASSPNVVWMQSLHQPKLSSQETQYLKKKGLKNPVNDIITDLMKHNELIPYQGVLGGKMGFHSEKDIYVVSNKLVRAFFDDGHTSGWMLLEYQVTDKNKIFWKVLESYLE